MDTRLYQLESNQPFSKSKIWQLNRDFYEFRGIKAFSEGIVPHHMTSNYFVGKTYAELIFGFLKDLAVKGETHETVYIVELGAGHGRLAFHVLNHLLELQNRSGQTLPPFCYVLTDIIEENLDFFFEHPQFQEFLSKGILDVSFFDAIEGSELNLRHSKKRIQLQSLNQPIIALANYFFDSIPSDLFYIKDDTISSCEVSMATTENPSKMNPEELIKNIQLTYSHSLIKAPFYENKLSNEILDSYKNLLSGSYIFFPQHSIKCISNLKQLSKKGMMLLSIDKGYHDIRDLESMKEPDVVNHGSFSIWVNFHTLGTFCQKEGGKSFFPSNSTFHLQIGAMLFLENADEFVETKEAYHKFVDDFGPDDFNSMKQLTYANISRIKTKGLIALIRLSAYDSIFFVKLLPRLKQVSKTITFNERKRIAETMHQVWGRYFSISESIDLPYEMGGLFYDLGFYKEALIYFEHSVNLHGQKADTYYNVALSHYQLREDKLFYQAVADGNKAFPNFELFKNLEKLDMA